MPRTKSDTSHYTGRILWKHPGTDSGEYLAIRQAAWNVTCQVGSERNDRTSAFAFRPVWRADRSLLPRRPLPLELVLGDLVVEALAGNLENLGHFRFVPGAFLQGVREDNALAFLDDLVKGPARRQPEDQLVFVPLET